MIFWLLSYVLLERRVSETVFWSTARSDSLVQLLNRIPYETRLSSCSAGIISASAEDQMTRYGENRKKNPLVDSGLVCRRGFAL
jgi:hypothetical protein